MESAALKEAREYKQKIWDRRKEAMEMANAARDTKEKRRQEARARILAGMYRDACDEVRRLEGRREADFGKKDAGFSMDAAGGATFGNEVLWRDLRGMTWGDAEGAAWDDIIQAKDGISTGRQSKLLNGLLNDGLDSCTEKQRKYIRAYYMDEMAMEDIAEEENVRKSTVSRCIKRGLAHVAQHTMARLNIALCVDQYGRFDYLKFCRQSELLTERQSELMYLTLAKDATYEEMGQYLGRNKSSVCVGLKRAERRLKAVRVDFIPRKNVSEVKPMDWGELTERELAERMGLSYKFAYANLYRGETVDGIPLMRYHALCLMAEGSTAEQAAKTLGCSPGYCRAAWSMYRKEARTCSADRLPPYRPCRVERKAGRKGAVLAALRDLTRGCDEVIDRITPEVLEEVEKRGSVYAGA